VVKKSNSNMKEIAKTNNVT